MLPRFTSTYADGNEDIARIHHVTSRLRITEFELFQRAYHDWFGHAAEVRSLERLYVAYMFNQAVPHWVRHFCRQFLRDTASAAPALPTPDAWDGNERRTFAAVAAAAALAVSTMIAGMGPIVDVCRAKEDALAPGEITRAVSRDAGLPSC